MSGAVLVLGATSSVGQAIAHEYARKGYDLILAARDTCESQAIARDLVTRYQVKAVPVNWDAVCFDTHANFAATVLEESPSNLVGVFSCTGVMFDQRETEGNLNKLRQTFDVNLTGTVWTLECLAPYFEKKKEGFIGVVSSVAGDRGRQSNYLYGAAKGGLNIYLEGLRNRLTPSNVAVTTIKPGFIDTKMTWGKPGLFLVATPQQAAVAMVRAVEKKAHTAYVPGFWRWIMTIIWSVPEFVFKKMKL